MQAKIIYLLLLTINYCTVTNDLRHFISKYFAETEIQIFIAFCILLVLIEYLSYTNELLDVIPRKTRNRFQLVIHLILAANSITITILEGSFNAGAVISIGMLVVNLFAIHKWIKKITPKFQ